MREIAAKADRQLLVLTKSAVFTPHFLIMAKAAVAAVLQKTLGPFVDGIDAKSLELSVWDGDVKLDQLQLRTSALAALELPLRVVGARLGSVRVQIPWRNLGGEPMIVTVDRLFLVLAPRKSTTAGVRRARRRRRRATRRSARSWRRGRRSRRRRRRSTPPSPSASPRGCSASWW